MPYRHVLKPVQLNLALSRMVAYTIDPGMTGDPTHGVDAEGIGVIPAYLRLGLNFLARPYFSPLNALLLAFARNSSYPPYQRQLLQSALAMETKGPAPDPNSLLSGWVPCAHWRFDCTSRRHLHPIKH